MRVSIGMLAYNEQGGIAAAIRSVLAQSLFERGTRERLGIAALEFVCVPNGCRDATAAVAQATLAATAEQAGVTLRVAELAAPGKARAWNAYVHELSDPAADLLILADADIAFADAHVLEALVAYLAGHAAADVATDVPLKAFAGEGGARSVQQRVSSAASAQKVATAAHAICGQLYCARAPALRRIWMPPALPVEDGFLSAWIKTAGFTRPPVEEAVMRVDAARHFYEAEPGVRAFLRHETRIIVGSVINAWLFDRFRAATRDGAALGETVRRWNAEDPGWLGRYVAERSGAARLWAVPGHFMWWRLHGLAALPPAARAKRLPVALVATALNLVACLRANRALRRADAADLW